MTPDSDRHHSGTMAKILVHLHVLKSRNLMENGDESRLQQEIELLEAMGQLTLQESEYKTMGLITRSCELTAAHMRSWMKRPQMSSLEDEYEPP